MSNYFKTLFQQGVENLKKGNFNEAENCFEELKSSDPTNKNVLKNLLVSCVQNEKFEKSEKIVHSMFHLGSREKELIELLLFIYKQQDKIIEAKKLITKEKNKIAKKI